VPHRDTFLSTSLSSLDRPAAEAQQLRDITALPDSAFNRRRPLCIYEPAAPAWPLMTINPLMMSRAREDTAADTTHRAPAVAMTTHLSAFSNRTFLLHDNDDVYTSRGHYRTTAQHNTVCHHT